MNLARMFSYTRRLEEDLEREREQHEQTRREAKEEREHLIDAYAKSRGGSGVFAPPPPPEHPLLGKPAVGPTMTAARAQAQRDDQERHKRQPTEAEIAEAAHKALEDRPPSRPNGDAEEAVPIAPDKVL